MSESKREARARRGAKTRNVIARSRRMRIVARRSGRHCYAQLVDPDNRVLTSASTLAGAKDAKAPTGSVAAARAVGEALAKKIKDAGVDGRFAFDRGGFKYHGRIKAIAEGVRAGGIEL